MVNAWYEPFLVNYRECSPDPLSIGPIDDQLYTIGYQDTILEYEFDQYPCNYTTNFTVYWLDSLGGEQEKPYFITQELTSAFMTYSTDDLDDVGVYSLRVMIGLDSEVGNTAYADFKLTI